MSTVEGLPFPANWYADPYGRSVQRYWNGVAWTNEVVDAMGQRRTETSPAEMSSGVPMASAQGHGIVIQNIVHQPQPQFRMPIVSPVMQTKSTGTAVLLTVLFGPLGLFYASVAGGAILTALTVLTLGLGILITWPVAIVWSIVAVSNHNQRLMAVMAAPQPIHSAPYTYGQPQPVVASPTYQPMGLPSGDPLRAPRP